MNHSHLKVMNKTSSIAMTMAPVAIITVITAGRLPVVFLGSVVGLLVGMMYGRTVGSAVGDELGRFVGADVVGLLVC